MEVSLRKRRSCNNDTIAGEDGMEEKEEVKELTITRAGFVRVNLCEKENLGDKPRHIHRGKARLLVGRNQLPGAVIFKTTAILRAAVSCVSGYWTPLSRPCLESGVRSFSGGKRGLEEVTVWDAESV
ncbi:hypothetical protein GB937_004761 [Aspergillus fischeri]|nr:hypothetical protein GB937_004761 [Aspergillus fischeri]